MKKVLLLLLILSFILIGCSEEGIKGFPDDKKVNVDIYRNILLENGEFSTYVESVEFSGREENWGVSQGIPRTAYFLDINVISNESFESLSLEDKFFSLKSMIETIKENDDFSFTGNSVIDKFGRIAFQTRDNIYAMEFLEEWDEYERGLVINSGEVFRPDKEQQQYLKGKEEREIEDRELEIYQYMKNVYNEITNNGANYDPEIHDSKVDELASEQFGISKSEANRIYLKYELGN